MADNSEVESSGIALEVPEGMRALPVSECPELSKKGIGHHMIMFDWDSGWELGQVLLCKGIGARKARSA